MYRTIGLLLGLVLLAFLIAACHVQIQDDGTFEVFGAPPTPTLVPIPEHPEPWRTPTPGPSPTPHIITPTPVFDGKLSDWNIAGVEHVEATATPRPTPTTAYTEGELIIAGTGPLSIRTFTVPRGRYVLEYRITDNDETAYCINYADEIVIGCRTNTMGNLEGERRVTIDYVGGLTITIGAEAKYTLKFDRVD